MFSAAAEPRREGVMIPASLARLLLAGSERAFSLAHLHVAHARASSVPTLVEVVLVASRGRAHACTPTSHVGTRSSTCSWYVARTSRRTSAGSIRPSLCAVRRLVLPANS